MSEVRLAVPTDVDQIVDIARDSFDPKLLSFTIWGCPGISTYISALIRSHLRGGNRFIVVYTTSESLVGFAEFVRGYSELFLNHIYVRSSQRGRGIGRQLLNSGIEVAGKHQVKTIALDVFSSNHRAFHWYTSLGFQPKEERTWLEVAIPSEPVSTKTWYAIHDLPQADLIHAVYGFSQITLTTKKQSYSIGRLEDRVFRCMSFDFLTDNDAHNALYTLGGARKVICIDLAQRQPQTEYEYQVIGTSWRCAADIKTVVSHLKVNT